MERSESSLLIIKEEFLQDFKEEITAYLKRVDWTADAHKAKGDIDLSFLIHAGKALNINEADDLSIIKNAIRVSEDRFILSNTSNIILNALKKGYSIGKYVAAQYAQASGLELMMQKNKAGSLHQSELAEFGAQLLDDLGVGIDEVQRRDARRDLDDERPRARAEHGNYVARFEHDLAVERPAEDRQFVVGGGVERPAVRLLGGVAVELFSFARSHRSAPQSQP